MMDVKAEFAKVEKEIDRLSGIMNKKESFDRFVLYCDDFVKRLQNYFENGNAPMGVRFTWEAQM